MLENYENGYAVMTKDLSGIVIESIDFNLCKEYCSTGHVIVERMPKTRGFSFQILFFNDIGFHFMKHENFINIQFFWLWVTLKKEKLHRTGKVLYENTN